MIATKVWIMVVVLFAPNSAMHSVSAEFNTLEACNAAVAAIRRDASDWYRSWGYDPDRARGHCFPKGLPTGATPELP